MAFDLYARSAVSSAAVEAARSVAGFAASQSYDASPLSERQAITSAEARARSALGHYGDATTFAWRFLPTDAAPEEVELRVRFDISGSSFDLARPMALPGLNHFDRTVRVRVERIVCPAAEACGLAGG